MVAMIISGGQTGVDRAALDLGLDRGWEIGGWCPRGRRAEDGTIPAQYPLMETPTSAYQERTRRNVAEADATLIISPLPLSGGTAFTEICAEQLAKPFYLIDSRKDHEPLPFLKWLLATETQVLNIAGPRESSFPGIYDRSRQILDQIFPNLENS